MAQLESDLSGVEALSELKMEMSSRKEVGRTSEQLPTSATDSLKLSEREDNDKV